MADEATPNESEGLDVNSDEGFNRFIAGQVDKELSSEQIESLQGSDPSVASGLEYPESQPRDEQGRFVPKEEPAAPPALVEEAAPTGGEQEAEPDPLAALIEQHGGDVNAALAAAIAERDNAQSLIGRQGSEVGELREALAELRGRIEATPQAPQQVAPAAPLVTLQQLHQSIGEAENPRQAGPAVMNWIVQNAPDMIDDTLEVWNEYDPLGASRFGARMDAFQILGEAQAAQPEVAPAADPWVETKKLEESVARSVNEVRKSMPPEDWEKVRPVFTEELDKAPDFVKVAAFGNDEQTRVAALQQVLVATQARIQREAASQAATEAAAQAAAGKQSATVISGALRPPAEPKGEGERTPEQVSKMLREALLATEGTSIQEGLTYDRK